MINWPDGKKFAFTIFDDTDNSTVENTKPVYDFLAECGFRTTKSCWVREPRPDETGKCAGKTTNDALYLKWLLSLQSQGFEIGLHNVSWASSARDETIEGFRKFEELFGHPCKTFANHTSIRESIYWGNYRMTGVRRLAYNVLTRLRNTNKFNGHIESADGFWGDVCMDKVTYVRNFTFKNINTLKVCPFMPYHDPVRPFVNYWFASTDGHNCPSFMESVLEKNQDFLEEEGGACIMYTHFASNFFSGGKLNPQFKMLMKRLSKKDGWFPPAGVLLDYIAKKRGHHVISKTERSRIEWHWLKEKVKVGHT